MKYILTTIILFTTLTISAQTEKEYTDLVKQAIKIEAKEYVYKGLNLSEAETTAFDPVFNRYIKDEGKVMLSKIALFDAYANSASTFSAEEIDKLNKDVLKMDLQRSKLNQKYYGQFVKAIGVEKATAFFFLKKYLDNRVEAAKLEFLAK